MSDLVPNSWASFIIQTSQRMPDRKPCFGRRVKRMLSWAMIGRGERLWKDSGDSANFNLDVPTTAASSIVHHHHLRHSTHAHRPINQRAPLMLGSIVTKLTKKLQLLMLIPLQAGCLIRPTMVTGMPCALMYSLAPEEKPKKRVARLTNFEANFHYLEPSKSQVYSYWLLLRLVV